MKRAISLALVLLLLLALPGVTTVAEMGATETLSDANGETQAAASATADGAGATADAATNTDEDAQSSSNSNAPALKVDQVVMYQKNGKEVPSDGFPITKGNRLTVRVTISGGTQKANAKGRVTIGTDIKKPKKDLASTALDKVRLNGDTEFNFSLKKLSELKSMKEYKVFFQSSKTKAFPAIARVQIGTVTVISDRDAARIKREQEEAKESEQAQADNAQVDSQEPGDTDTATDSAAAQGTDSTPDEAIDAANADVTEAVVDSADASADGAPLDAVDAQQAELASADEQIKPASFAIDLSGLVEKDIRVELAVASYTINPAQLNDIATDLTVNITLSGGKAGETVMGEIGLVEQGDPSKTCVASTDAKATSVAGSTTFTIAADAMAGLKNNATYNVVFSTPGTIFYNSYDKLETGAVLTVGVLRAARPAMANMSLNMTTWNLTQDSGKDVVLTVDAGGPAVPATFTLKGKSFDGADLDIEVEGATSGTAASAFTFPKAELRKLAPGTYPINLRTDTTDAYLAGDDAATGLELVVTGDQRTVVTINSYIPPAPYSYKMNSASTFTLLGIINSLPAGAASFPVTLHFELGGKEVTYDSTLAPVSGDVTIPANWFTDMFAAGKLVKADASAPYIINISSVGDDKIAPIGKVQIGSLAIVEDASAETVLQFKSASITNGDAASVGGGPLDSFARARGVNADMTLTIALTTSFASSSGAEFTGRVRLAKKSTTWNILDNKGLDVLTKPFTSKVSAPEGKQIISVEFSASEINRLPEDQDYYVFGIEVDTPSNGLVQGTNFGNKYIGVLWLDDKYAPRPTYEGKNTSRTWTVGGKNIVLQDYVTFAGGLPDRTMTANVYASPTKLTSLTVTPPSDSGVVLIGSQEVYAGGTTPKYTLQKKYLDKLTAGTTYYLYIQGEKSSHSLATVVKQCGTLTVKSSSGGSGGTGGTGGTGGSDSSDDTDTTTASVSAGGNTASDTAPAEHIAFGTYQAMDIDTLEWMLARQPLMGREFLKYLLNQKGSQYIAIPLAHVADMVEPIRIPITGGGEYLLGYATFTPQVQDDQTGYLFEVEAMDYADLSQLKMHLGVDFQDLAREQTDSDYFYPDDFVPVTSLVLAQIDGAVPYDPAAAEKVVIDPDVTNRITEWMSQG